ncbi:MAG: SCO family protein [Crocinitomicaceae bacterium TMED135]|nr:MAG: SCO family protein [Crocinitomicaceae bacterium TMED135]|tara:strand:+ start:838 stop:1524 length:687 start_codon:yes stop_codon:yes gene_type:complete
MRRVLVVFIIFLTGAGIIIYLNLDWQNNRKLPVFQPNDINPDLVDSSLHGRGRGINGGDHCISNFELLDQLNHRVTKKIMTNKIVVTNFFFVSCPSICPKMTQNLLTIHNQYKEDNKILILSHTVWPEVDKVNVLFKYAEKYKIDYENWRFLTGDKIELYRLARQDYLVVPDINDPNFQHGSEADFIHTENIVLLDQKQRIRGYYDGTDPLEMNRLLEDIEILKKLNI